MDENPRATHATKVDPSHRIDSIAIGQYAVYGYRSNNTRLSAIRWLLGR